MSSWNPPSDEGPWVFTLLGPQEKVGAGEKWYLRSHDSINGEEGLDPDFATVQSVNEAAINGKPIKVELGGLGAVGYRAQLGLVQTRTLSSSTSIVIGIILTNVVLAALVLLFFGNKKQEKQEDSPKLPRLAAIQFNKVAPLLKTAPMTSVDSFGTLPPSPFQAPPPPIRKQSSASIMSPDHKHFSKPPLHPSLLPANRPLPRPQMFYPSPEPQFNQQYYYQEQQLQQYYAVPPVAPPSPRQKVAVLGKKVNADGRVKEKQD
ncbi:hypothetical protein BCR33DRAFT_97773 [Rhizoclosmatium globosum]|uniref:Uncharacterized protein n=1 Tax=Rhizoclosmatium globosum TaxID=329046 RepID=A0A1Y2CKB7_9FUNG|nr:hypothetical protein BCR33DRAFT_97773 [Rhizoclosmatium globosum]|eukprot:ORY47462.1 hypothetical protein BCR33DRAFT_97773 [Rhizoclosmatium globosum]